MGACYSWKGSDVKIVVEMPLNEISVGMRIAENLVDDAGRVLVPAGTEVNESLLAGLRRRNIETARIEQVVVEDAAAREARRVTISTQLDHLFRKAGSGEETRLLYHAVLEHRLEHQS